MSRSFFEKITNFCLFLFSVARRRIEKELPDEFVGALNRRKFAARHTAAAQSQKTVDVTLEYKLCVFGRYVYIFRVEKLGGGQRRKYRQ